MAEIIKVTTQTLKDKKEELQNAAETAKQKYLEAMKEMSRLEAGFQSDAISCLQKSILIEQEAGMDAFFNLTSHIEKLLCIADIYEEAERGNINAGENSGQQHH